MLPVVLFGAGAVAFSAGAWMAWHPAGPLVAGGILMFLGARFALAGTK